MPALFRQVYNQTMKSAADKAKQTTVSNKKPQEGLKQKPISMRVKNAVKNYLSGNSKISVDDIISMQMTDSKGTHDQANKIIKNLLKAGK